MITISSSRFNFLILPQYFGTITRSSVYPPSPSTTTLILISSRITTVTHFFLPKNYTHCNYTWKSSGTIVVFLLYALSTGFHALNNLNSSLLLTIATSWSFELLVPNVVGSSVPSTVLEGHWSSIQCVRVPKNDVPW